MNSRFRKVIGPRILTPLLAHLMLYALTGPVHAEKADKDKPPHIAYAQANIDDLNQVQVFTGDVILTKGTITIRCDKLTVRQDPEGYQHGTAIVGPGKLVYFRQKREGFADQFIEGQAERIEYDEKADLVNLYNQASVKRIEAEVMQDEVRGDTIVYNSDTEIYRVEAAANGRAHAILAPSKKKDAPSSPPATSPATSTSGTSPAGESRQADPLPLTGSPALLDAPHE